MMSFKQWFQANETMTSTGCVAGFSRPMGIGMVRRKKIPKMVLQQPQIKEGAKRMPITRDTTGGG